jgi:transcriptional repressor NrdR
MNCPFCGHKHDRVIDSRESKEGDVIRRRRQCLACERRFTTYERIDEVPYMVVKKDGRRERFDRQKVLTGLLKACEKRPVGMSRLAEIVDDVEAKLAERPDREISTTEIGEYVMERLRVSGFPGRGGFRQRTQGLNATKALLRGLAHLTHYF